MSTNTEQTITLTRRKDYWVAIDAETGVGAQGPTRESVLDELDDAIALHESDGEPIEDEASILRELGIDIKAVEPTEELPEFLR